MKQTEKNAPQCTPIAVSSAVTALIHAIGDEETRRAELRIIEDYIVEREQNKRAALVEALEHLKEQHEKALKALRPHYPQGFEWGGVPLILAEKALELAKEGQQ